MRIILYCLQLVILIGCCQLPFVYCGPKINELEVVPTEVQLGSNIGVFINIKGWQYSSRENTPYMLELSCDVLYNTNVGKVLLDDATIYLENDKELKPSHIELFEDINEEGVKKEIFYVEFRQCCAVYPVRISFDSIPIIVGSDTTYENIHLIMSN